MLEKLFAWLAPAKPPEPVGQAASLDDFTLARAKRQMERELRAAGHSRASAKTATAEHFSKRLRGGQ